MQNINSWYLLDTEGDVPLLEYAKAYPNNKDFHQWHENFIDDILDLYAPDMQRRIALDIGGCVGMMAVPFAQHYEQVHTFEINPAVRECLKLNTAPYPNIAVHECGTGKFNGEVKFRQSLFSGISRVIEFEQHAKDTDIQCPVRMIDSFNFNNVDLIKLDVEGYEYDSLYGAVETLKRCKPLVIAEIHSRRTRRSYNYRQRVFKLMEELGYKLIDVRAHDYIWR